MKLFFETNLQAVSFITTVPFGFFLSILIDFLLICNKKIRPFLDALFLSCFGIMLYVFLTLSHDRPVRLYHLLGSLCGALLYIQGVRKVSFSLLKYLLKRNQRGERRSL